MSMMHDPICANRRIDRIKYISFTQAFTFRALRVMNTIPPGKGADYSRGAGAESIKEERI